MKRRLLLKCGLALGDIVMLTAAVRDLHRCYPHRFLTDVQTSCPEIWENNPYLTPLSETDARVEVIECSYPLIDHSNTTPYHCLHGFIDFLNSRLGLNIRPTAFKGDIHISRQEKAWHSQVMEVAGREIPFWILLAGGKYDITIKWWQVERYQQVVNHFKGKIQFVQLGDYGNHHPKLQGVIDFRGETSLRELIRLLYHSQGALCSVTGLMHLAAAVEMKGNRRKNRPCVVIAGGREPAHWEAYPDHQFIHTNGALACCSEGGCWKDRVVPLRDGDKRDGKGHLCVDVVGKLPHCMDLITPPEVIRRIQLYFSGDACRYLTEIEAKAGDRATAVTAKNPYDNQALNQHSAGLACERFIEKLGDNGVFYQGRGVVICGGGVKYFTNAWVCINMLRHFGCQLPIQLWYLGPREMDNRMKALMQPLGVECVDAHKIQNPVPIRQFHGWTLKPFAILRSCFREVLFLDADNVPVVNPEFLFDTPEFRRQGAIFWPDYDCSNRKKARPAWRSCNLRQPKEPEFESGQMVLDKNRCAHALRLTLWFNENSDFYYHHIHGDKETFHMAFRKLNVSYALIPKPVHGLPHTMCQHDFDGRRIFQHRNTDKWDLDFRPLRIRGFWYEKECSHHLAQLRRNWNGRIGC
jgi:ADP-heptose:LPS heptosyltransferase